jgi:hypothetical protein
MALGNINTIAAGGRRIRRPRSGAAGSGIARGLGLDSYNYWRHGCPFINLIHGTSIAFNGTGSASVNSLGWITNMPSGQSVQKTLIFERAYPHQYVRPGNYVATWSGPMVVSASGTGLTNLVVGANRTTFTLPALSPSVDYTNNLTITVTNSSGSAQSLSDLAVFHADDEADYLAGEIFSHDFLTGLNNSHVLRFMDWLDTNWLNAGDPPPTNFSEYRTEAHCDWTPPLPPSLIGKLALKTGKDIWINTPITGTQACFNSLASAIVTAAGAWTGKVYATYSNENWNFAQHILYLQNTKYLEAGNIVDANGNPSTSNFDRQACAQAYGCLQSWAAFEALLPRERVVRTMESFIVNFNLHGAPGFKYVDQTGLVSLSSRVEQLIDLYATAPYMYANAVPTGYPADMSLRTQLERKDYQTQTNAWYREVLIKSVDNNRGWMDTNYTAVKSRAPQCALGMYEGGSGVAISIDVGSLNGGAINYESFVDPNDNTMRFLNTDITTAFDDAERACMAYNAVALFAGQGIFRGYRVRRVTSNKLQFYATDADYTNNIPATLSVANVNYQVTVNTGDNTIDFGALDITSLFSDGDRIAFWPNGTALFTDQTAYTQYPVRRFSATKVRVYLNTTTYASDTPVTLLSGGGTYSANNATRGHYYTSNITRGIYLAEKLQSVFESADGVTAYQYHYEQCIASGITQFMHFVDNGGWFGFGYSSGGDVVTRSGRAYWGHWGLKRAAEEADSGYPIAQWFRGLT